MELLIFRRLLAGPLRYRYDGNAGVAVIPKLAWLLLPWRRTGQVGLKDR